MRKIIECKMRKVEEVSGRGRGGNVCRQKDMESGREINRKWVTSVNGKVDEIWMKKVDEKWMKSGLKVDEK